MISIFCPICGRRFFTQRAVDDHIDRVHGPVKKPSKGPF